MIMTTGHRFHLIIPECSPWDSRSDAGKLWCNSESFSLHQSSSEWPIRASPVAQLAMRDPFRFLIVSIVEMPRGADHQCNFSLKEIAYQFYRHTFTARTSEAIVCGQCYGFIQCICTQYSLRGCEISAVRIAVIGFGWVLVLNNRFAQVAVLRVWRGLRVSVEGKARSWTSRRRKLLVL